jgi:hypothetical protein
LLDRLGCGGRTLAVGVLAVVLPAGCTVRSALVTSAVSAGVSVGSLVALESLPKGPAPGDEFVLIFPIVGGAGLALAALAWAGVLAVGTGQGTAAPAPAPEPEPGPPGDNGLRCHSLASDPAVWVCGPGFRCTDDFASCEPAAGMPEQRVR